MLTRRDYWFNFFLLRVLSAMRILPVGVDIKQGILKVPKSLWKRGVSFGFFGILIIHSCYVNLRLVQVLIYSEDTARHHLVFHVNISLVSMLVQGWYLLCFVLYPNTFVALFNDVFTANSKGCDVLSPESRASRKPRSRQELLALAMPMSIALAITFILCVFTYDRTMAFLLYSSLPSDYKTPYWFRLLLCEEALFLTMAASNFCIVLIAQLLFFEKVTGSLKLFTSSIELTSVRAEEISEGAYKQLRNIQLKVSLFNSIHRFIIFSFKLFCIALCTLNGYFMIAHFSVDPIFGCLYYIVFGLLCSFYSIMYERAYVIPEMVSLTKSTVLLRVGGGMRVPGLKRKIEMMLRSVPAIGIQVGRFHTLERVATPVFLDYVLRNVTGLLVMHLRS